MSGCTLFLLVLFVGTVAGVSDHTQLGADVRRLNVQVPLPPTREEQILQQKMLAARTKSEEEPAQEVPNQETAQEKREERRLNGTAEEASVHGAVGMPHEGAGLETELPRTMAEDSLENDNALHSVHGLATQVVMPASLVFLLCIMLGNVLSLSKYTSFIPESALTLGVAVSLGLILHHAITMGWLSMESFTIANAAVLNLIMLPIIVFNAGWSLQKANFMSQLEYILVFAILGTVISTLVIGFSSWSLATHLGFHEMTSLRANMVFAALISAVDPVATLSTYSKLGVAASQPLLNTMVFGESAINDAVAIVLFDVINLEWETLSVISGVQQVAVLLFGSMGFGILLACILVLFMRLAQLPGHTSAEILYVWVSAYFIYSFAETVGVSGIIANLFGGMVFGIYGRQHLAPDGRHLADHYLELSGETADTGVFILCGCSVAMITSARGIKYGFIAVVLCLIARAISVPVCAAISNVMKKAEGETNIITVNHQIAMWHGGLRGGIALVLALEIDGTWCKDKGMIINATFIVICVLLLFLGGTTELLLKKLGLAPQAEESQDEASLSVPRGKSLTEGMKPRWFQRAFFILHDKAQFVLVGHNVEEKMTKADLKKQKIESARSARSGLNRLTVPDGPPRS